MRLKKNPKMKDWAEWWLATYVEPVAKPSGYEHYHDNLYKHILPELGEYRMSQLTTPVVQKFLNHVALHGNLRNGGPLSAKSVKNMRVVLDVCCKRAVADGYMPANPVPMTVYTHCRTQKAEVMTDRDQQVLEEWLFEDEAFGNTGILLGLYTGLRLGEVCALRWGDYDFETGMLHVHQTIRRVSKFDDSLPYGKRTQLVFSSVKSQSSDRELFLPEVLQDLLAWQYQRFAMYFHRNPSEEDFVVYNGVGGLTDPDNLSHYFGDVLEGLHLPHVKYHALRHTFATRAVENGVDVATISGLLGHADVTTTTHYYVHPREEAMRQAMAAVRPVSSGCRARKGVMPSGAFGKKKQSESVAVAPRICRRRKNIELGHVSC